MPKRYRKKKLLFSDMFDETKTIIKYNHETNTIIVINKKNDNIIAQYKQGQSIGKGVNGYVYDFNVECKYKKKIVKSLHTIVKKQEIKEEDKDEEGENEYTIIKKSKHKDCNFIRLRTIYEHYENGKKTFIYIMNKMKNDVYDYLDILNNYIDTNNIQNKEQFFLNKIEIITKQVNEQVKCLFSIDNKYVYTDLKPENIGVNYDDKTMKIKKISLLDLGSVLPCDGIYISTYPCKEHQKGNFYLEDKEKLKCINIEIIYFILLCLQTRYDHLFKIVKLIKYNNQFNDKNVLIVYNKIKEKFKDYNKKYCNNFINLFMMNFKSL